MTGEDYQQRLKNTGRNDPCPCGSGRKYKKCHLQEDEESRSRALAEAAREAAARDAEAEEEEKKEGQAHPPDAKGRKVSPPSHRPKTGAVARQVSTPRKVGTS